MEMATVIWRPKVRSRAYWETEVDTDKGAGKVVYFTDLYITSFFKPEDFPPDGL